ncbi:MAG: acyl-CoA dehydrogenase family protein, partial [SAR324 cluster bacterium]|nr:acyl-CoA dehydrogenase family protein [SAR324 cluster bacterium]
MDLKENSELTEFRQMVRQWLTTNAPKQTRDPYKYQGMEDDEAVAPLFRKLAEKNWLAFRWPKEFGGAGFNQAQQFVFVEELQKVGAPMPGGFGLSMVGPLILEFGTDKQRKRFLPRIAQHDETWCQGYSEPNAGSDLAGLQTRAELKNGQFLVNGQKVWTSR